MPKPNFSSYDKQIAEMIRVNHAGEYGAKRIYEGQIKFSRNLKDKLILNSMLEQEKVHLNYFEEQMKERNIRPSMLMPLWHRAGYIIGAISASIGLKSAMLVTDAVEDVIERHYSSQLKILTYVPDEKELAEMIKQFREDELEHKTIALQHDSSKAFLAKAGSKLIKMICEKAISLSKKI